MNPRIRPRIRLSAGCLLAVSALLALPGHGQAQYVVSSPAGDSIVFEAAELRTMLDTARALRRDIEEDPHVLYTEPAVRETVSEGFPDRSYPWNVVTVHSDSTVDYLGLPANLREADRAYYNYAVMRMRVVREADPDVPCDSLLALEEEAVGSFIDGWVLSRTLFGGPAFGPLDELAFARDAGHLKALLAAKKDRQVGACAGQWAEANLDRVAAYETWRKQHFPTAEEEAEAAAEAEAEPDESGDEESADGAGPEGVLSSPDGS